MFEDYIKWRYGRTLKCSKGFFYTQNLNIYLVNFQVCSDSRLHLGDKEILNRIACELNFKYKNKNKKYVINLTTIKFFNTNSKELILGIDWSKPLLINIVETIEYYLSQFLINVNLFSVHDSKKIIGVSNKIASSNLRTFGLNYRIDYLKNLFISHGFDIIYFDDINNSKHKNCIKSINEGEYLLENKKIYALICFDNFWMHVAKKFNVKVYVIQRRKLNVVNLINHIGSINTITGSKNIHYIT